VNLVTLRKVRGQPLWISVSLDKSAVLAGSIAHLRTNCLAASALTVIILAAMELMFRTEASERQKSKELKLALNSMARLASEDSLTGLLNRRGFQSALQDVDEHSGRTLKRPDQIGYAILLLDLDRFKVINDTLGHRIGDLLLQATARRLESALPRTHILARLGGDEFAVLARNVKTRAELDGLAQCLTQAIREPFEFEGYRVRATISIGLAVGPTDGASAEHLLMAADLALYAAKEHSRDNYQFYQRSMAKELAGRRDIETGLREALERDQLELHFQPIVRLRDSKIVAFEALARWNHPRKGLIPPSDFIPVAEDTGLMPAIGEWVLITACRQIAQLPDDVSVAINLSPTQFSATDLIDTVRRALSESGLAPRRLELEITERLLLESSKQTLSILRELRQVGVKIALDDFGTGYSSMSYLRKFPLDKIKIDHCFVSEIETGSDEVPIIRAVLSIARAFGMEVTAEGVETDIQKDFLTALGCDSAQGYLFARPLPYERIVAVIADRLRAESLAA
jgi:diguanylate cyclase (GGDEF)-like protein